MVGIRWSSLHKWRVLLAKGGFCGAKSFFINDEQRGSKLGRLIPLSLGACAAASSHRPAPSLLRTGVSTCSRCSWLAGGLRAGRAEQLLGRVVIPRIDPSPVTAPNGHRGGFCLQQHSGWQVRGPVGPAWCQASGR